MASCDDDFSLLGDDQPHHHHQSNPNHPHHIFQQQSPYAPHRFAQQAQPPPLVDCGDDVEGENDADSAFAFDSNNNNQSILDVRTEKRKDLEDVNNGDVTNIGSSPRPSPYTCKKAKAYSNEYRKDREEWSDAAIACLLDAYLDKFTQLNRGNLRGRDWEEVAATVSERCEKLSKSVEQCKNKVDNLKKRYKLERHRMTNGGIAASHWPWFKKMEEIVGNSLPVKSPVTDDDKASGSSTNSIRQTKRYIIKLISIQLMLCNELYCG